MNIAQTTQETLGLMKESLTKSVTLATGLTAYDLQAPAKNLYPVITPLRNSLPRVARLNPGDAARWRTITSITGSGYDAMGWVPEGQRTASMSYAAQLAGRALSDARRGRHGDLRSGSRRAGLRGHQLDRDAAPAAEDHAQGGDRAARRQHLAGAGHARRADAHAPREPARRCPPPPIRSSSSRSPSRAIAIRASPAASPPPRPSPATTATPTPSTAALPTSRATRPRR